jgi:hypothetical protein
VTIGNIVTIDLNFGSDTIFIQGDSVIAYVQVAQLLDKFFDLHGAFSVIKHDGQGEDYQCHKKHRAKLAKFFDIGNNEKEGCQAANRSTRLLWQFIDNL